MSAPEGWEDAMSNEPRTCPHCGIFYYEWLHGSLGALIKPGPVPEPMVPNVHECPEPYHYAVAETLAAFYGSSGIPVSQTVKARIRLGLEGEPDA